MLEIFNTIGLFIEDCYREIGVREYSRIMKISPPSASNLLKSLEKEGLLKKREDKGYLLFRANRENEILLEISRVYWKIKLKKLVEYLDSELNNPTIFLFGSLSKLESKKDSDIDLAIISKTSTKKTLNSLKLGEFEKDLERNIQPILFKKINDSPKELRENILNGYLLKGRIE